MWPSFHPPNARWAVTAGPGRMVRHTAWNAAGILVPGVVAYGVALALVG